jgi:hypothetical protein
MSHKAGREVQRYQMESEVSKILVDLSTLMFMRLRTTICCKRLFVKVAFRHKQGYMVEKPKTIHRSPPMFLTHLEGTINELQLINCEKLVNEEPCQRMDLLTMVVESLFVIDVGRRIIHIHNLISSMVK